jgi:hypothetical protein
MNLAADRRRFMAWLAGLQLSSALCPDTLWVGMAEQDPPRITRDMLAHAVRVAGDPLPDDALDAMLERVNQNLRIYAALNARRLDNSVAPPHYFNPVLPGMPVDRTPRPPQRTKPRRVNRPASAQDVAYYTPNPVATLNTSITNLTGQPCVVVPHGFNEKGLPTSLTFVGRVFGEATMLAAALAFQQATDFHLKHPKL